PDRKNGTRVPAIAADDVDPPRVLQEDVGEAAQRLVAGPVAELVIHRLEAIQVHQHHRDRVVEAPGARDFLLEWEEKEAAIVKAGDLVLEREFLELRAARL